MKLRDAPAPDTFDRDAYTEQERKARLPPGQTLAKKFPHLEYAKIPIVADPEAWQLRLYGEVNHPREVSLKAMMEELPEQTVAQDFHCITGWSVFDTEWQGIIGDTLVSLVEPHDTVTTVLVHGLDEFSTCLWIEDFCKGVIAWGYRGQPLAPHHGFPLRFVAPPRLWQYKACKWLTGLEFLTEHRLGFWETRAYSDSALAWENDRYANPTAAKGKSIAQLRSEVLKKEG